MSQNLATTVTHINGAEAKKMLKNNVEISTRRLITELLEKVEKIPYLKLGNAYPNFKAEYALIITAYPADCPVPEAEFAIAINAPDYNGENFRQYIDKVEILEAKEQRLLDGLEAVTKILDIIRPRAEEQVTLDAGNIPDQLRIDQKLPIPMIQTSSISGRKSEVMVDVNGVKK